MSQGACINLVQECCTTDLSSVLNACYMPVPIAVVKTLVQQMLAGIQACHEAGKWCIHVLVRSFLECQAMSCRR